MGNFWGRKLLWKNTIFVEKTAHFCCAKGCPQISTKPWNSQKFSPSKKFPAIRCITIFLSSKKHNVYYRYPRTVPSCFFNLVSILWYLSGPIWPQRGERITRKSWSGWSRRKWWQQGFRGWVALFFMWDHVMSCDVMCVMWDHVMSWDHARSCDSHVRSCDVMWDHVIVMWDHVIVMWDHVRSCDVICLVTSNMFCIYVSWVSCITPCYTVLHHCS